MIALDPIDGALTIAFDKATDTYRIKTMNRDPYPSLEVYHDKDGRFVDEVHTSLETTAGPYVGLRPDAPRDTIP